MADTDQIRDILRTLSGVARAGSRSGELITRFALRQRTSAGLAGAAGILDAVVELLGNHDVAEARTMILDLSRRPAARADFGTLEAEVDDVLAARNDDGAAAPTTEND